MRLPLFIANRYLLAKKSHNLINIITWISILGISVGSFALIVVLSAFNGLEKVISSMNNRLTPDLQIAAVKGKTIDLTAFPLGQLKEIQGVEMVIPTITEDALFRANDKQHIGQVKGVGLEYQNIDRLNEIIYGNDGLLAHHTRKPNIQGGNFFSYVETVVNGLLFLRGGFAFS